MRLLAGCFWLRLAVPGLVLDATYLRHALECIVVTGSYWKYTDIQSACQAGLFRGYFGA
jgi:hypothetical protein